MAKQENGTRKCDISKKLVLIVKGDKIIKEDG